MSQPQTQPQPQAQKINWREIHRQGYLLPVLILCCGIFIYGSDYAFGATIMPIAVREIGGAHLINWVISIFELGAIMSAVSVPILVKRYHVVELAKIASCLYIVACVIIALAPRMEIIVAARFLQGLGGGAYISLALVTISAIFPPRYFIRLMAIVSAVWGTASFSGPLIGGIFAELGIWRGGFIFMGVLGIVVASGYIFYILPFLKTHHPHALETSATSARLPKIRLLVLAASILCFAAAGIVKETLPTLALLAAGLLLFAYMVRRDKSARVNILPKAAFTASPSGFGMLVALLAPMGAIAISTYGPIFMHLQFATTPITNGYVIVLISVCWSISAFAVGHFPPSVAPILMRIGILLVALSQVGMGLAFYSDNFFMILPFAVMEGLGFGICWSFIAQRTIRLAPKGDRERTSTSLFTMQRLGFAIGSALLGVVVNGLGFGLDITPEHLRLIALLTLIAPVPLVLAAVFFAWRLAIVPLPPDDANDA